MRKNYLSSIFKAFLNCLFAFLSVAVLTILMKLIGRDILGEAVIALLYLVPVGWSSTQWNQRAGVCAAVTAALAFDYFFIPPFYTFAVGRIEGWLVLAIFLAVSIVVIGRIQTGFTKAQNSEREAIYMYEMSSALSGLQSQEAVIHSMANTLQLMFQAQFVEVCIQPDGGDKSILASAPPKGKANGLPDRIMPILAYPGLVGEIRIWRGFGWLPAEGSRLLNNFAMQASQALERARLAEAEARVSSASDKVKSEA
jgi:K+-sensing histidine kinase KdpD